MSEEITEETGKDSPAVKKFIIISICLALIFLAALYYMKYAIPQEPRLETVEYKNFIFTKKDNIWFTDWQRGDQLYNLAFRFNPIEAESVPTKGWINESFNRGPLYLSFNLTDEQSDDNSYMALAASELALTAIRAMDRTTISACMANVTEACSDRPIVTCDSEDKAVVEVVPADKTRINMEGNCIRVQGSQLELVRAVDKLLYYWYRIM